MPRSRVKKLRTHQQFISDVHDKFWVISELDIREMLAKTQKKIAGAVGILERAARKRTSGRKQLVVQEEHDGSPFGRTDIRDKLAILGDAFGMLVCGAAH